MHDKFYAVLDTNVLVSALLGASHMSNPTKVLHAVTDNRIIPLYNNEIIEEYRETSSIFHESILSSHQLKWSSFLKKFTILPIFRLSLIHSLNPIISAICYLN